ncbi:UTRA domain-containing protein [Streptomyces sp. NPDC016640]|uniref:UTRA domain-containing protein n=1 Tax=Streptomyces sp. NPDC016640 TaxID=3364969 RepID=UPI0036F7F960
MPYIESGHGDAWGKEAAGQGRKGTQRILKAGHVVAPPAVSEALAITSGALVASRQRLILLDDTPVELAQSYWPAPVAQHAPLVSTKRIPGGAVSLLATLGYAPGAVTEEVSTRPPTEEEAEALDLTDSTEWILSLTRTISTPDEHPYEVSVMVSPGRVGRLHYSMKVD